MIKRLGSLIKSHNKLYQIRCAMSVSILQVIPGQNIDLLLSGVLCKVNNPLPIIDPYQALE